MNDKVKLYLPMRNWEVGKGCMKANGFFFLVIYFNNVEMV